MKYSVRTIAMLFTAALLSMAVSCPIPGKSVPPPGDNRLNVPYHHQETDFYCVPATVQMWQHYKVGYTNPQNSIWAWMRDHFPYPQTCDPRVDSCGYNGGGAGLNAYIWALSTFATAVVAYEEYLGFDGYRSMLGDIDTGIDGGNPTAMLVGAVGSHTVLVYGASWHELATLQPSKDYVVLNDPMYGSGGQTLTVDQFQYDGAASSGGGWYKTLGVVGQRGSGTQYLEVFDTWGGTYYGDPNPPDGCPNCADEDGAPSPSSVSARLLVIPRVFKGLFARPAFSASARFGQSVTGRPAALVRQQGLGRQDHGPRRETFVPHPKSTKAAEILENCLVGLRQSKMAERAEFAPLVNDPGVSVDRLLFVKSNTVGPDYYLLRFMRNGKPFALVTVGVEGWVRGARRIDDGFIPANLDTVGLAEKVQARLGRRLRGLRLELSWTSWGGGSNHLFPDAIVDTDQGEVIVTPRGELFVDDPAGTDETRDKGGKVRRLRKVQDQQ